MVAHGRFPTRTIAPAGAGAMVVALLVLGLTGDAPAYASEPLTAYRVDGDAIVVPLTGRPGDPAAGRAVVANRQVGLCLLCHVGPIAEERFQGNLAPGLAGAGGRWSPGQLRLRIADSSRLNPQTIMPSYYRVDGLHRVASGHAGKPILSAQQVEDVVAFLATLKE